MITRRSAAALALAATVLATGLAVPAYAGTAVPTGGEEQPASPAPGGTLKPSVEPDKRDSVLQQGWQSSPDLAWTVVGDAAGLHVLTATAKSGYAWVTTASLKEDGFDTDRWIGNACLTSSGRRLVVAYAPRTFTNKQQLFERGGFVAVVDLVDGQVRKLPVMSTLAYFSPGCGEGEKAVVTQHSGEHKQDRAKGTRLLEVDAGKATVGQPVTVASQLTSAIPTREGIVAAGAGSLLRVAADGRVEKLAPTTGVAFDLGLDSTGSVVFLERSGERATVKRADPGRAGKASTVAQGALGKVGYDRGAEGRTFLIGEPDGKVDLAPGMSRIGVARDAQVSTHGQLAVTKFLRQESDGKQAALLDVRPDQIVRMNAVAVERGAQVEFGLVVSPGNGSGGSGHPKLAVGAPAAQFQTQGSPSNPVEDERTCSVPRNDPRNQAVQPKPRQVEWAVNQAVRKTLYVQREANWKNLGMPAYRPQDLFQPVNLEGGGFVPSQVMLGILAQESNLWQASSVAVPGVTASPLIGNFYGRPIYDENPHDDWDIRWNDADCGYGVGQITDGMRLAGRERPGDVPARDWNHQRAIALDFAANIAAGVRILSEKWNETRRAGVTLTSGNGRASGLENWFFAVWAYNTGFHPESEKFADNNNGAWGVGWVNNPINPNYRQDRLPFLEHNWADAAHPQHWPYPEKVMGFAGHAPDLLEGPDTYVSAFRNAWWSTVESRELAKPPLARFCDPALNDCLPEADSDGNFCIHRDPVHNFDFKCWWHTPTQWKGDSQLGNEVLRFDPGYAYQTDATSYPPVCSLAGLPPNSFVIDDTADNVPSVRPDCPRPTPNAGSFALDFASDHVGLYPSKIDFHQIGSGFGGHFWFAHARGPSHDHFAKMRVTGTWTFNMSRNGWGRVMVHLPSHGAHTQQAAYEIDLGNGFQNGKKRVILQNIRRNAWVSLGVFQFSGIPKVRLASTLASGSGGDLDVAFDAIALQTLDHKPRNQVVALGDSFSSGEGMVTDQSEYDAETNYRRTDDVRNDPFWNACHRTRNTWSRQARLPDSTQSVGARADANESEMDYHLLACSGARTRHLLPFHSVPPGVTKPTDAWSNTGAGEYGQPSQLDRGFLDENTTLVTLTIGGNDAEWGDVLKFCALRSDLTPCEDQTMPGKPAPLKDWFPDLLTRFVKPSIMTVVQEIHRKAPNAKIMLMGYPILLDDNLLCRQIVGSNSWDWIFDMNHAINFRMDEAAEELRWDGVPVWYANPRPAFWTRGACGNPEGIHKVIVAKTAGEDPRNPVSQQSFHPKVYGAGLLGDVMTDMVANGMN